MDSSFPGSPNSRGGKEYYENRERRGHSLQRWVQSYLAQREDSNSERKWSVGRMRTSFIPPWRLRVPHRSLMEGSLPPALGKNFGKQEWESSFGTCWPEAPTARAELLREQDGFRPGSDWCLCCSGRPCWPHCTHRVPLSLQGKEAFRANQF